MKTGVACAVWPLSPCLLAQFTQTDSITYHLNWANVLAGLAEPQKVMDREAKLHTASAISWTEGPDCTARRLSGPPDASSDHPVAPRNQAPRGSARRNSIPATSCASRCGATRCTGQRRRELLEAHARPAPALEEVALERAEEPLDAGVVGVPRLPRHRPRDVPRLERLRPVVGHVGRALDASGTPMPLWWNSRRIPSFPLGCIGLPLGPYLAQDFV